MIYFDKYVIRMTFEITITIKHYAIYKNIEILY